MPWTSGDAYRHTHKAKSPTAQRQWAHVADSALERGASEKSAIMQANGVVGHRHAAMGGALAHLPTANMPKLAVAHQSPLAQIAGQHFGGVSHPSGMFGAHARMPRIPIADTLRNIDAPVHFDQGGEIPRGQSSPGSPGFMGAVRDALSSLKDYVIDTPRRRLQASREGFENSIVDDTNTAVRPPLPEQRSDYARGGSATMHPAALRALHQAITHLQNMDAGSAAATLRASPAAMAHPDIQAAERALRTHQGVAPAQKTLTDLGNADQASRIPAPFRRGGHVRRRFL